MSISLHSLPPSPCLARSDGDLLPLSADAGRGHHPRPLAPHRRLLLHPGQGQPALGQPTPPLQRSQNQHILVHILNNWCISG
eukprot:506816-Rhodomonas_salina.1